MTEIQGGLIRALEHVGSAIRAVDGITASNGDDCAAILAIGFDLKTLARKLGRQAIFHGIPKQAVETAVKMN